MSDEILSMIFNFTAIFYFVELVSVIANGHQEQLGLSHHAILERVATNNNSTTSLFAGTGQKVEYSPLSEEQSATMASEQNKEYFK